MKWLKKHMIIIMFSLLDIYSFGQIDHIIWQECFGTSSNDDAYCIEDCNNGHLLGILIKGDAPGISNYHGEGDAWIINIDSIGNIIWERCYGGSKGDKPKKILKINNSSFYLLNSSVSDDGDVQNNREGQIWIVKIDSLGNIIWESSYGGSEPGEIPEDAIVTPDGGLLFMSTININGGDISKHYGLSDLWLCKIDSIGQIEWERTYGNHGIDKGLRIKMTSDTTVLLIGRHNETGGLITCPDFGDYGSDVWIVEIDLYGDIINQWCYGGSYSDIGYDVIHLTDGYGIAASTRSNDGNVSGFHGEAGIYAYSDIWVVRIDKFGNVIWQKCLGGFHSDNPTYITRTGDDGLIIFGNTYSNDGDVSGNHTPNVSSDIWVVKLDISGDIEWEHCFGGEADDMLWGLHTVLQTGEYSYILAAESEIASFDVQCDLYGSDIDAWIIEVKDCSFYITPAPSITPSPDTLCITTHPISEFSVEPVPNALGYEWFLEPEQAGVPVWDSLNAIVTWNQEYEGQAELKARSFNECGYSDWSEPRTLFLYNCLGTDDNHIFREITVYPNPAHEYVVFQTQEVTKGEICIYNIVGKLIDVMSISSKETVWRIDKASEGLYLYTLRSGDLLIPGKFVIQK